MASRKWPTIVALYVSCYERVRVATDISYTSSGEVIIYSRHACCLSVK
jgi:hypothetical protein